MLTTADLKACCGRGRGREKEREREEVCRSAKTCVLRLGAVRFLAGARVELVFRLSDDDGPGLIALGAVQDTVAEALEVGKCQSCTVR